MSVLAQTPLVLSATSSSGLPVSFESTDLTIAAVSGNELTGIKKGVAEIRAFNSGDDNYLPAETLASIEIITTHANVMYLFTPNNDGFNDLWEIPGLADLGRCEVRVFNRWGKQVYASSDYNNSWDGVSNGAPLPEGAYPFIIKTENQGVITGTVNIVR
jgi:gliding motility-associated-like protein